MFNFRSLITVATLCLFVLAVPITQERAAEACTDVIVIFARGTTEPAPIGIVVGPPLQTALVAELLLRGKSLTFTGVDYPASIPGFLEGGDPSGSKVMASALTDAAASCPNAAIVSAGYDQGGQLVHNSAKQLSPSDAARINAVVIFVNHYHSAISPVMALTTEFRRRIQGDPENGQPVQGISSSKVDVFCHVGDDICSGGDLVLPPHLTYVLDTPAAAAFIASKI
ncbi:cutinase [Mycena leptocephala]|nr:cutinase [Mycena leptocephala]